jgi:hypothetical protein
LTKFTPGIKLAKITIISIWIATISLPFTNSASAVVDDKQPFLKAGDHKCVKGSNVLSCSGSVINEGLARTKIVQLIVFLKNNEGKIVNMIESTTKPFILDVGQRGNYDISVSLRRLTSNWTMSGAFAFSK